MAGKPEKQKRLTYFKVCLIIIGFLWIGDQIFDSFLMHQLEQKRIKYALQALEKIRILEQEIREECKR